jgi:hypothetical protein
MYQRSFLVLAYYKPVLSLKRKENTKYKTVATIIATPND